MSRPVASRAWVLAVVAGLAGCGGAAVATPSTPPSPPVGEASVTAVEDTPTTATNEAAVEPALPVLPRDHLLPTADGVAVFEIASMRKFDIRRLARAFVLEIVDIDLLEMEQICGFVPSDMVDRMIVSGSLRNGRVLAAFDLSTPATTVLDCFGKVYPQARARELAGRPALELGHRDLWVTERDGVLLIARELPMIEALGGVVPEPIPPMIDGIPVAEVVVGDVTDALALVSRHPDRLIAVGHHATTADDFFRLPTLSITFAFDGETLRVDGDLDMRRERQREDLDELKRHLRRDIAREMQQVTGDAANAEPLLVAVDEARLEHRDGHLIFSGRTRALQLVEQLVNGVAEEEIERELRHREISKEPTKAEAAASPAPPRAK